ncbi:hypothetical protein [Thermococcus peptonophilus]|uniref:hypothetical protein n=1 Tax=Thermococcus peptonophilus TaxID=53952 RepID=UPI000B1C4B66
MSTYLGFVRKTIHLAERRGGINVENLTRAYNETVKAYGGAVLVDLKEKNLTRVVKDLEVLKERKSVLDDELRRVHEKLAYANAKEIVLEFLVRGGEKGGIQIAQNAIQAGQERGGYNVNRLQENLDEFLTVYGSVKSLANKGEWGGEALKLIQKNRATIGGEFYRTVSAVIRGGAREEELQEKVKNMKAFLWSFSERAKNDARALQELREKGVNTKRAEVQLRAAVNEVGGVGIYLVRERKPEMARIHFENALNLLKNIEDFIRANS